jgi:hypothetical protein
MKAEHRKELQTNTLAQTLGNTLQGLKEGPSRSTVVILVIIILAVVLIFTWRYFSRSAQEADSTLWFGWDNLAAPDQVDAYLKVNTVETSTQNMLARFLIARTALHDGMRDLGNVHSKEARDNLNKAANTYSKLAGETTSQPLLNQEALLGSAQAKEALGDYAGARTQYGQLAEKYKDTLRGKNAQKQVERLDSEANKSDLQELKNRLAEMPTGP